MVELKLDVKKQNIQVFKDVYDEEKSKALVQENKKKAFGMLSMFDKAENIKLTHSEKRYEPFWHIIGESYIEYLRKNNYSFNVDPQVREVNIAGNIFKIEGDKPVCNFEAEDRCVEHFTRELITDAMEGKQGEKELKRYIEFETKQIKETEELMGENKVVVPAKIKASFLVRDFVRNLIKPVHADKILNEKVEITKTALYFRPIYAFEFTNVKSSKTGVLEVDALTGVVEKGKVYKTSLKELIPEGALFDVGAEMASWVIPGAGIGAAVGKAIKQRSDEKKAIKRMKESREMDEKLKEKKGKKK
ncbi:hypothetical protein COV19_07670 [Candidatus Woesearchaeota archaeon CG10_big_fil_rev_8_21_14_0_10_44_13]|nr:MAG: hypothetical protein COV19_07670 [Candidatus Woesearchaeota archaeon CG10_big_fil_rev_8_21_14_0_10_44_13]